MMLTIRSSRSGSACEKVRDWYMKVFPTDSLGETIDPELTFLRLAGILNIGNDVYDALGCADSVIRERCLSKLAEIFEVPYDVVYSVWMG